MGKFSNAARQLVAAVRTQEPPVHVQEPPVTAMGVDDDPAELAREEALAKAGLEKLAARRKAAEARVSDLMVAHNEKEARARRFAPEGALPAGVYVKARRAPLWCPGCRRKLMDDGGQAVTCMASDANSARFRCRACGHTWMLPVKLV